MIRKAAATVIALCLSASPLHAQNAPSTKPIVNEASATVHKTPSVASPVIGTAPRGTELVVTREVGDWVKIAWPSAADGVGYVRKSALAQVALAARLPGPAAGALEALTRMCPEVGQYQYLLGVSLMSAGDAVRATEALQAADRLEPGRSLTLAALGLALNSRKQFADAKAALTRSLELDADRVEAIAALAESEASLGDLKAAESHARRALDAAPADATAHLVIGMVRLQESRYDEARDALVKAAASDPQSPKADYQLSLVYARLGDTANAERSLESYRRKLAEMNDRVKAIRAGALPREVKGGGNR